MNAIEWLKHIPEANGARDFLIDARTGQRLTFADIDGAGHRVGAELRRRGLSRGDRVGILLHNSTALAKLYFGCLYAGIVTVPVNPVFAREEVDFILASAGVSALVVSARTCENIDLAALSARGVDVILLDEELGDAGQVAETESLRLEALPDVDDFESFSESKVDDLMAIVYTSGTTGRPSGVAHRISSVIDNERLFNTRLGIGPDNRFYNILAMTYLGGYHNLLLLPYAGESSVVLADTFSARSALDFWGPAREHGVNTLWLVPTIMSILMEMDRGDEGEAFCREHVKLGLVGTAPLPVELRRSFESRYGIRFFENYGLSETLFATSQSPDTPLIQGSVGQVLPGVQVAIVSEEGVGLPYGEEGEVQVCTPHLMSGYLDADTHAPDELDRTGWFKTGDIGRIAPTGELTITGRKKDLIIRGGINISPAAIENVLHHHESVVECAVVGVPHAIYGEDIAAVVRLKAETPFQQVEEELRNLCRDHLGAVRQPGHFMELEVFPHSSSGKIQKAQVRDLVVHRLGLQDLVSAQFSDSQEQTPVASSLPGRVRRVIDRPSEKLIKALSDFPTSILSDCLNRMGVMDGSLRALVQNRPFCGPAVTVEEVEGGNLMSHVALELIQPGDVLVIDAKAVCSRACWGGVQTKMAQERGVGALVVNGAIRDLDDITEAGVPVYAIGCSPSGPFKGWGGNVNYPISCGGSVVRPGDIVAGDNDGIVVIRRELASELIPLCQKRLEMETVWLQRVEAGESTVDIVGLRESIDRIGITYE